MSIIINVLKAYKYRGAKIYIRQLGGDCYEYWAIWHNIPATHHFIFDTKARSLDKYKTVGGIVLGICQVAEALVDQLIAKHSWWHKLVGKYFYVTNAQLEAKKVKAATKLNADGDTKVQTTQAVTK